MLSRCAKEDSGSTQPFVSYLRKPRHTCSFFPLATLWLSIHAQCALHTLSPWGLCWMNRQPRVGHYSFIQRIPRRATGFRACLPTMLASIICNGKCSVVTKKDNILSLHRWGQWVSEKLCLGARDIPNIWWNLMQLLGHCIGRGVMFALLCAQPLQLITWAF